MTDERDTAIPRRVPGRKPEFEPPSAFSFTEVIRPGEVAQQSEPTLLVQLATYDKEFVAAVSAALDHHLRGFRLEKMGRGVAMGAPPDIFTIAVAGLSAAAGAITSAFLGEIGKELWKALKGLVANWAEADRQLEKKGRQEPVLARISSIGEKGSEAESPAKTIQIMMAVKSPMPSFQYKAEIDGLTLTGEMRSQRPEDIQDFLENGLLELYRAVTEAKVRRAEEIATNYVRRDSKWEPAGRPRYRSPPKR